MSSADQITKYYSKYKLDQNLKHSVSPVDLSCTLSMPNGVLVKFATMTMLSWSEHRDKFPVSVMSHIQPVGFTKGHRMIAGTLVFSIFDRAAFSYALDPVESIAQYSSTQSQQSNTPSLVLLDMEPDELPPFDIHMVYANAENTLVYEGLRGVTLLDSGGLRSMDMMMLQESYSFMAMQKIPLQPLDVFTRGSQTEAYQNKVNESSGSLPSRLNNAPSKIIDSSPASITPGPAIYVQEVTVHSNGQPISGIPIYNSVNSFVSISQGLVPNTFVYPAVYDNGVPIPASPVTYHTKNAIGTFLNGIQTHTIATIMTATPPTSVVLDVTAPIVNLQ